MDATGSPPPAPSKLPEPIRRRLAEFIGTTPAEIDAMKSHLRAEAFEQLVCRDIGWSLTDDFSKEEAISAVVGGDGDKQIDGVMVFVNGQYVSDLDEYRRNFAPADLDAVAICILQATQAEKFEQKKMAASGFYAVDLLQGRRKAVENDRLAARRALIAQVLEDVAQEGGEAKVEIRYCFVAMGDNWDSPDSQASRDRAKDFRETAQDAFLARAPRAHVEIEVYSLSRYYALIKEIDRRQAAREPDLGAGADDAAGRYEATVSGVTMVEIPATGSIARGFVGVIETQSFVDLLEREDGLGVIDELGKYNVRSFLSENSPVNKEIAAAIEGPDHALFAYHNNGVVIVADGAELDGDRLTLRNYHVVNGLQTSNLLYNRRQLLKERGEKNEPPAHVVVKIAVTADDALREAISKSSNRQTAIPAVRIRTAGMIDRLSQSFSEARASRPGFALHLETSDGALEGSPLDPAVIVTRTELLRAVGATLLRRPHAAAEGGSRFIDQVPHKVFNPAHPPEPYLMAAQALSLANAHIAETKALESRFRHHLAFGLFLVAERQSAPKDLAHGDAARAAEAILDRFADRAKTKAALEMVSGSIAGLLSARSRVSVRAEIEKREKDFTRPLFQSVQAKRRGFDWGD